ncbi:hypothetical protein H2200_000542 [Cladophialophora chaetospira]|uniref:Spt20-like SEP domain-containing protein n=1 Tax=Cladophialophora chaetospira TaxID=386627 RepID=A0AA39CR18_9EURO|nr:hypothetical protein H2200_000542 [Cladophialophora chaetospira]
MAAVMAKPAGTATKMKKPPTPVVQTNMNGVKPTAPSASPSSARKSLPGQGQTPTSATSNNATVNGATRQNRRLQRLTTRNNSTAEGALEKRAAKKYPEPYGMLIVDLNVERTKTDRSCSVVPKDTHILRKFKGCTPSLIVHLHPTHFRFDQQDGSFSYRSEMRVFIDHLAKGTIPHDMVEEFRKSEVKYYDGWLIVRVVDHKAAARDAAASGAAADDEKPFSIHNYNQYITPSPYAPYPTKEQSVNKSPRLKQEQSDQKDGPHSDETINVVPKSLKPQPRIYHVALRPTILSRHMDLVIDAMQPDPKSLYRKGSQANVNGRAAGAGPPQTPISGMPPTPSAEKGPPFKKQKLKIDPKDMIEYEGRVVNAIAPPLYLDAVESLEEAETLIHMLKDPLHDQRPPSPKSRKRTVAELAADDAHAKGQERFMLVMDERTAGTNGAGNAGAVDGQAAAALFQPRFEKFNALDNIKREIAERKQREKDRQLQEDENRRGQQERMQEEEKKRIMMQRTQEARMLRARQAEVAAAMAAQQQQQQPQQTQPAQRPSSSQVNGIPPNMRNQMMQGGSPIIRQGTPHAASSPVATSAAQGGVAMAVSGSQQGHGSPPRPGSAVQHGHPSAPMTRGPSQQGPSRNGTPQIPHGTPAQRNATPIMRQNTPAQSVSHASPHGATQQMPAGMMPGMQAQMPNGVPRQMNPQQMAELQRRHALQQQAAQQAAMQNGMVNGTPQMSPAQVAQLQAHQQAQAQANREAAMRQQQQHAMQSQQGTPQIAQMSPVPNPNQKAYNQQLAETMKAQMQNVGQGQNHMSPAPNHMTPQQQQAQLVHAQAQQQQRMMQAAHAAQQAQAAQAQGQMMGQGVPQPRPRAQMDPETQQQFQRTFQAYQQRLAATAAAKYGGNPQMLQPQEIQQIKLQANQLAQQAMQKQRHGAMNTQMQQAMQMQQLQARQQQMAQQQGGGMPNGMMGMQNMQGGQVPPNMAQVLQQQQAQHMQQMQMQHAQQMMAAQQHQQQQQNMQFQQR